MTTELVMPSDYHVMTYEETMQDGGFNWKNAVVLAAGIAAMAGGASLMYLSSGPLGVLGMFMVIGGLGMTLTEGTIGID